MRKQKENVREIARPSKQLISDDLAREMTSGLPGDQYFETYRTSYIANYMTMYLRTAKPTFVKEPK
jgi:hypothetical protein